MAPRNAFLILLSLTLACGSKDGDELDPAGDEDGDGLNNGDEEAMGTDPRDSDSDGDGFEDGAEVADGTNPTYEFSHTYEGGYDVGFCASPPTATGPTSPNGMDYEGTTYEWNSYQNGDVPENFAWLDQHGETVNLYSFCDKHVVIAISAGWCGPCRTAAATLQSVQDSYWGQDVQFVEVIMQNDDGQVPDQAFLQSWASDYGFTNIPVLKPTGEEQVTIEDYVNAEIRPWDLDGYIPSFYHLDASVTIISADEGIHDPQAFVN